MSRFDPIDGMGYGGCVTCGHTLATEQDAHEHRVATMPEGGRSHSTRAMNPTREQRIQRFVDGEVEDAIRDALDNLQGAVDDGDLTSAEVAHALGWHSDFADEWVSA